MHFGLDQLQDCLLLENKVYYPMSSNTMKILLQHGEYFSLCHGGFQIQIQQTKEALEGHGVSVEWHRWWDPGQNGDLIHYFGRPSPGNIRAAAAKGIKFVFSELLTSQGSRSRMRVRTQGIFSSVLRMLLPSGAGDRIGWQSYQLADGVIALTGWEAFLMNTLYGAKPQKTFVIGNGVEKVFFDVHRPSCVLESAPLICSGTITERKRMVELAEAAILAKTPVWIVGRPYSEMDSYYRRFMDVVRNSQGIVRYNGEIQDRGQMAKAYSESRGFVLVSDMESQSLSALEAAAVGLPVLVRDLPWARETFGSLATYVPDASPQRLALDLRRFFDSSHLMPVPARPPAWRDVGTRILNVYRSVLGCRKEM
jgi:glycosyltransferase involved in cell wall biosynthesis